MIVRNLTQKTIICEQARIADTSFSRAKGLLGKKDLPQGQGLIITRCNSIHMFFMQFAIDVIFIDGSGVVVGLTQGIRPWELSQIFWSAHKAIEIPAGMIGKSCTKIGDIVEIEKNTL